MTAVTLIDHSGGVLYSLHGDAEFLALNIPEGQPCVDGPIGGDWYADGQWHTKPVQPSKYHAWDWPSHAWIDPRTPEQQEADAAAELAAARAQAHAAIERWRDVQESAGTTFEHAGHRWDCGIKTRERLQPVLALPALPEGFFWTDADNVDVPMTLSGLAALSAAHEAAIVARGFAIHIRQRELKEAILLMTLEQLADFAPDWSPTE